MNLAEADRATGFPRTGRRSGDVNFLAGVRSGKSSLYDKMVWRVVIQKKQTMDKAVCRIFHRV